MIAFLLGMIIGLLGGAGFVYWALRKKITEHQHELKQTKRTLTDLTRAHERRVEDTVTSLQRDYRRQLETKPADSGAAPQPAPLRLEPTVAAPREREVSVPGSSPPLTPPKSLEPVADPWGEPGVVPSPEPIVAPAAAVAPPVVPVNPETKPTAPIAPWGNAGGALSQLLAYHTASDAMTRQQVAIALGQRYSGQPIRPGDQAVIATLSVLCQDGNPGVRQAAVEALGTIKSAAVIPVLQRALRDTDAGVVKAASLAIAQFKRYPIPVTKTAKSKSAKR